MRPGIVHVPPPDPASAQAQPNPEKRKILSNNTFADLVYGESLSASWRTRNDHRPQSIVHATQQPCPLFGAEGAVVLVDEYRRVVIGTEVEFELAALPEPDRQ